MDQRQLADFLRTRREALRPEDVGLPAGQRRRGRLHGTAGKWHQLPAYV